MRIWSKIMQKWKSDEKSREISVVLFDQFSNHCLANAIEPLRAANTLSRKSLYRWRFFSIDGAPVVSSSGLPVTPAAALAASGPGDCLFVMPSYDFLHHTNPRNLRALRAAAGRHASVAGMDMGAWLLAAAGLLDQCRATVHWDELQAMAETFPEVEVVPDRFVIDGDRLTCGGVTTTFDLILHLIRQHHGPMLALEVAALFMHGTRPSEPDWLASDDQMLHAAVALMRRNLEAPLPMPQIAATLGLSLKGLETLFAREVSATPQMIYKALRLREARRLAEHSNQSIAEIATRCGYSDPAAMTRAFRAEFGLTPSQSRQTARAAHRR